MTTLSTVANDARRVLAEKLITFLQTNRAPDGLFAADVFCDYISPLWRQQASGRDDVIALRVAGHPSTGRVPRWRFDPTPTGFVLEFDEEWERSGDRWTSHELARCDVTADGIVEISVFCTGDWSSSRRAEHAAAVTLLRS
ncbi:MAG TPA: hypothetical protein VFN80_05755 [Acidothermaceae bacterium]|nr:hypothetical protein [Acidothermaceae bacterium]